MIIKLINCSDKKHKELKEISDFLSSYFTSLNIENYEVLLKDFRIVKCNGCRVCTQEIGLAPVKCFIKDEMNKAIDEIEEADAYVIIADRNSLFSKNKIHEKFSKRLAAYYYWPFGKKSSELRNKESNKKSILINFNSTRYFMNHSFYTSKIYMKQTSNSIGAEVVDWLAMTPKDGDLVSFYKKDLEKIAQNLVESLYTSH